MFHNWEWVNKEIVSLNFILPCDCSWDLQKVGFTYSHVVGT